MSSINFKSSISNFGTQISDGIRVGPFRSLDGRGSQIASKAGIGVPLAPLFSYSGLISPSVFLESSSGITLGANTNDFVANFKSNPITINNNMSDDKSVFVIDYPRTIELQKRATNTGNTCLALSSVLITGEDFYGNPLSEKVDLSAVNNLNEEGNIPIGGGSNTDLTIEAQNSGYIADDGFTSTKKSFFKIVSISGTNNGVAGHLYIRTGNSIGLPFFTDKTVVYSYYLNKNFTSAFSGIQRATIRSGLALSDVSTEETVDTRGLFSVISSNGGGDRDQHVPRMSESTILRIGDYSSKTNPKSSAPLFNVPKIPFGLSYLVFGADLYYQQLYLQEKMIWKTIGTETDPGVKERLPEINLTDSLYGVKQNLEA